MRSPYPPASLRNGSAYVDRGAARFAVDMALPSIERLLQQPGVCGLGVLCLVVMDPALGPAQATFEDALLLEYAVGDRSRWDVDYAAFARAKARLSWETGLDGSRLQALAPHRLHAGDTLLTGAVCLDGIVVAASGAEPWADEACALCVAGLLRAVAKRRHGDARAAEALVAGPAADTRTLL